MYEAVLQKGAPSPPNFSSSGDAKISLSSVSIYIINRYIIIIIY